MSEEARKGEGSGEGEGEEKMQVEAKRSHEPAGVLLAAVLATRLPRNARAAAAQDELLPTVPEPFNLRAALAALAEYDRAHPGFFEGVAIWIAAGIILYVVALTVLLYTEIRTCLVVRDQDFRERLLRTQACLPGKQLPSLRENETALLAPRAYITVCAGMLFFLAIAAILFPLCDIFTIIGLPAGPCLLMLTIGALLMAVCTVTGWMALCWLCTRPWAALVLGAISVSGQMTVPSGNLLLILVWILAAGMSGTLYFYWLPGLYADKRWARPSWVQDVGESSLSLDPKEWSNSFSRSYEAHEENIGGGAHELALPATYQ